MISVGCSWDPHLWKKGRKQAWAEGESGCNEVRASPQLPHGRALKLAAFHSGPAFGRKGWVVPPPRGSQWTWAAGVGGVTLTVQLSSVS